MKCHLCVRPMTLAAIARRGFYHLGFGLGLLLMVFGFNSKAEASQQSLAQIQTTVKSFVQQHIAQGQDADITLGAFDPRLRLAPCDQKLAAFFPHGRSALGNTTVGVRCRGTRPWTLYVPVKVSLYAIILVAARPLAPATAVQAGDVVAQRHNIASLRQGYFTQTKQILGRVPSRPLAAGTVLNPRNLPAPRLVRRGDTVSIMVKNPRMEVRMQGEALTDGAAGDTIKVRNLLSRKIIQGQITKKGVIQIN